MNTEILNIDIQEFISNNLNTEISKILLKGTDFNSVSVQEIVEQIEAKIKCKSKLPTWFSTKNIYYPNKLNIEQTSSEIAAKYKSELLSGSTLIDITGGFGVDSFYFSKVFDNITHCEIDKNLSSIVKHNNKVLHVKNIDTLFKDGITYALSDAQTYDWMYIDPSRRHNSKGKVFFLKDCLPNIPKHLTSLFKCSKQIAIKTSPLLDISIGINELEFVKELHVVAIKNEVKELLWILENDFNGEITIKTVNIFEDKKDKFSFKLNEEAKTTVTYDFPQKYLFEPNAAILKSGGFNSIAKKLNLFKLHQHSHLYTSNSFVDFPGRSFKIETVMDYNKKLLKVFRNTQANITTRNFPENVKQIRNKFRIKDGGSTYIFFTTNYLNKKIVIICSKLD